MIIERPFYAEDALYLAKFGTIDVPMTEEQAHAIPGTAAYARTYVDGETGRVLFCGGITEHEPGIGAVWGAFHRQCRAYFLALHKRAKRDMEQNSPFRVLEICVQERFKAGHRWAKALGFHSYRIGDDALKRPVVWYVRYLA